ncbi:MAG: zinc ribbon domain-containing protein [Ruminococcaceae bacterium]|nr:zinc ribbon domain-containing protein [Oscillospiraceae bacterium]
MSMIYCRECGKQISDQAPMCPHCGAFRQTVPQNINPAQPVYIVKPKIPGRGFSIASLVLGIIGIYYAFYDLIFLMIYPVYFEVMESSFRYSGYSQEVVDISGQIINMSVFLTMFIFTFVLGLLAVIFGNVSHNRGCRLKKKTAGIVMGVITIVMAFILTVIGFITY